MSLHLEDVIQKLNALLTGKVFLKIEFEIVGDGLELHFADGSKVVFSTLGGIAVEELEVK